jgi:hypothetical protein
MALYHLHFSSRSPLAIDRLPPLLGPHADEEANLLGSFDVAGLVWIMHGRFRSAG